ETSTGPFLLGRINEPDSTFDLVQYESMVYDSDFVANQFPAFAPPNLIQFDSISFDYRDSCENSTTKLYPFVDPVPHNYLWLVDGSPVSDAVAPVLTLDPGGYQVTLAVERNGTQTQVTRFVEVFTAGFEVNLGNDTTICVDEILTLDAGSDGVSFVWNTGETTQTIDVDTTGTYWVEVTGATGCTVFDDIVVTEYGIQQQIGNQWYFGEMAGIDFNSTPPQPITDANLMSSPEGCASISDVNGQLLFYTNGMTVWNRDHEVMENGNLIGGDSTAAQSAMILPFPDDQTMFYVFTSEEVYGDFTYDLKYSIVDIKEDTAMGRVTIKGMTLFNNSTERVTASAFGVPSNLITHEFGNNSFRTNLISDQGIASTLYSPVGEVHNFLSEPNATGYMKFAPGLQNFATLVPGSNLIEIFDVVDTTGRLVNPRTIDSQEPTSTNLYGLEFSTDALKLYVTTTGGSSKLIQYDLDSLGSTNAEAEIEATKFDGYGAGSNFGALQRGPNGIIYMAVDNATSIGTINSPNGDDAGASFNASGFDLAGRVSRLGLPNFTQQVGAATQQPGLAFELACFGQPIQFTGSGTSDIDEYEWDFGPDAIPETSTDQTVDVIFLNDSTYDVTLRIFNRCGFDSLFTQSVEVFGIPEQPQVPDNPALCGDSLILTAWPEDRDDLNYYWSTGETTRSITVFEPAIIDVAIINTDGCSSDTLEVFVGTGNPFIDLGPDQTICQFETPPALDSDNANATYDWQIDGVAAGTDRFQNIDTSTPGLFEYTVSVIEPVTGCIGRDTIQITILEAPAVVSAVSQPSSCGANDGSIQFSINNTGTFTYEVAGLSSIPPTTFDGPGSPPGLFNLAPSSYTLVVTNTVTGCVTTEIILVEDVAPFDMSASDIPDCLSDADLRVSLSGTMVPTAVDIYIIDVFGDTIINQPNTSVPPTLINNIPAGTYQVSVQEVGGFGCIQTDTVQVVDEIPADNECLPKIVAPNAFSPNEDELNELFFVFPNPFVDTFQIFVYTRWGELVYFSDDLNFRWDGSFDNKTLPVGTYAYILKFTSNVDPEIGVIEQYGSITLIR
ncbi:MAG: gliding motility-associated C-terminal domain-containing protein, partial [Cyclobacteriaceae bacterium]|nr:gliding motility-associated C-terminal domain-containing protein [Cyclobacteriaceae bacterium HetDA_MAG_MS6]